MPVSPADPLQNDRLQVPSHSEVVLEETITPGEVLPDGPFGDHMGFYGGVEDSPWCASTA